MFLIVGLGNPGDKYAGNRHNVGFMAIDRIADQYTFSPWKDKFQGHACEGVIDTPRGRVKAMLLKPQTYYNDSGLAVHAAMNFYKIQASDVVVFHDEIDLAPGRVRMKQGGGHSGNNGIRSTIAHCSADVRRTRLGVGHPGHKDKVHRHVLSDFSKADKTWLDPMLDACARALPYLAEGDDERFQAEVMRLAPAPKLDQSKRTDKQD